MDKNAIEVDFRKKTVKGKYARTIASRRKKHSKTLQFAMNFAKLSLMLATAGLILTLLWSWILYG